MALRAQIVITGIVQGVGFRPFVYNLAVALAIKGYVGNTAEGVLIEAEGARLAEFVDRLRSDAPPLSRIAEISVSPLPPQGYSDFTIHASSGSAKERPFTLLSPDVSLCDDCLRELFDPSNRRYLYPFINCTNCGPRYSITRSVPYDRPNTTMAGFAQCPACLAEYEDPRDRRFHAQPNACPICGPRVTFLDTHAAFSRSQGDPPLARAVAALQEGGIIAVKGIGGFHLACDAENGEAVRKLRDRKRKSNKPFAVMAPSLDAARRFSVLSREEGELLQSVRRPVVLLRKNGEYRLAAAVAPRNRHIGVMLPYTPLHYLLFHHPRTSGGVPAAPHFPALVMTSGNLSEEPIVRDNDEARERLSTLVDGFLVHDRDIFMRVDDSVVRIADLPDSGPTDDAAVFLRRSRGYAPDPIPLSSEGPEVLGCGADLKNTFTLTKGKYAIVSQHIGDRENFETERFFEECLTNLKAVYRAEPIAIVHDLHPGYQSTRWAKEQAEKDRTIRLFGIQHHYAHIGSVMAEQGLTERVIGVAFDGTGYGTDGRLWGGEFLVAGIDGCERSGQLQYMALPGGETAIREPWRTAAGLVAAAKGARAASLLERIGFTARYGTGTLEMVLRIAQSPELSPLASGAGRLFDAVSALLGLCEVNTFEGEAAMALEAVIARECEEEYPIELAENNGYAVVDVASLVAAVVDDIVLKCATEQIAAKFHNTLASIIRCMVRRLSERTGIRNVALSGGTFQNAYLLGRTVRLLHAEGMQVYVNRKTPANDGGISLGQAYLVRERLRRAQ